MSGSSIRAFQKFQDKYIGKLSILQTHTHTHAKRNSCSYKPSSEPNTCGFSDDSYPLWIYLMSCEYANSSYEYWHNSTANKTPVGSGPSPREGLGMRLKCILSVASQLAPARRVLWHQVELENYGWCFNWMLQSSSKVKKCEQRLPALNNVRAVHSQIIV